MEWNNTMVMSIRRKQRKYRITMNENYLQICPVDTWIVGAADGPNACAIRQHMDIFKATAYELTEFYDSETYQRELLSEAGIYVYNKQDIDALRIWTVNAIT